MDTAQNKAIVEEFDRLGNQGGDLARLDALCMPDMVNHALAKAAWSARPAARSARPWTSG